MESLYVIGNLEKRTEVLAIYAVGRCDLQFSETIFLLRCTFSIVQVLVIYLHVAFLLHLKKTNQNSKPQTLFLTILPLFKWFFRASLPIYSYGMSLFVNFYLHPFTWVESSFQKVTARFSYWLNIKSL